MRFCSLAETHVLRSSDTFLDICVILSGQTLKLITNSLSRQLFSRDTLQYLLSMLLLFLLVKLSLFSRENRSWDPDSYPVFMWCAGILTLEDHAGSGVNLVSKYYSQRNITILEERISLSSTEHHFTCLWTRLLVCHKCSVSSLRKSYKL